MYVCTHLCVLVWLSSRCLPFVLCRNNPLWGTKAAKRLKRHQRSMSDPDMKQTEGLSTNSLMPHYLMAYSNMGSTPNMEKSGGVKPGAESVDTASHHLKSTGLGRSISSPQCVREAKDQHIRTFLATMAFEEEDQGIMENTASNSTSEFSSPLSLTPPDVEGVLTTLMRASESKCDRKEEDFEAGADGKEEGSKAAQDTEESEETDTPEEGAILMAAMGKRRNSDLPMFSPKSFSPEDAFLAGKRASVAEVHIFVQDADSDKGVSAEGSLAGVAEDPRRASSMEDLEEDREMVDRAAKSRRLSQSHSFPEELNTMDGQDEETNDIHLAVRQHRRSRSELKMNEIAAAEVDNQEESGLLITAPQIESVRERVKQMEKQAVGAGSSTSLDPAVSSWHKRVYSAPSLHSISSGTCLTPPHELAVSISRPSSRTSNWEEIAEETEEEAVMFITSDEAGMHLPASPPQEQTMDCDRQEEELQQEINSELALSHGQVTEQVTVEEKRPYSVGLCWEPLHSRSQSNVESSSVKALIQTLEKKAKPLYTSMQSLVRSDDNHKGGEEGSEEVSQGKVEEESDKEEDIGMSSGRLLESAQEQGCAVKRTQSLTALGWSSEQGTASTSSHGHAAVKKVDSVPLPKTHEGPWLTIPEIETAAGISTDEGVPSQSKESNKSNLVEMETLSASVLELTQKFEERKPKPPPQIKHSFSSSSSSTHKTCSSRPVSSDEERGKSASPSPATVDTPSLNM